jgi:hypothetical protein
MPSQREEVRFSDVAAGRAARQAAADQGLHALVVRTETVPVLVIEQPGFVPPGCVLLTVRHLPAKWAVRGAIACILESAGYEAEVVAEFGLPLHKADGVKYATIIRGDIQQAVIRAPADDFAFEALPRRFECDGTHYCKIQVQTSRPPRHAPSPAAA